MLLVLLSLFGIEIQYLKSFKYKCYQYFRTKPLVTPLFYIIFDCLHL